MGELYIGLCFDHLRMARLAQLAERKALNLVVVGSTPTSGGNFCPGYELFFFGQNKKKAISTDRIEKKDGNAGFRSRCLAHAKRALCQLSYAPVDLLLKIMDHRVGTVL